ncbi:MAG: alpha/beta hydrolase, partial [Cyanobacteria bacterium P01_A01_bin.135]
MPTARLCFLGALAGLAATLAPWPTPAQGAERLLFNYGILGRRLDVSSLEAFAEQGTVNRQLGSYFAIAGVDAEAQAAFRAALQEPAPVDPVFLSRILYTNVGDDILTKFLGDLLRTEAGLNGKYAIRAALILAAQDEGGLTTLNFLRYLPIDMRVNLPDVLTLSETVQGVVDATRFAIETLEELSRAEARQDAAIAYDRLPTLDRPGELGVQTQRWDLTAQRSDPLTGEPVQRQFYVNIAQPQRPRA